MIPSIRLACCTDRTTKVFVQKEWNVCGQVGAPSLLFSYAYEHVWLPLIGKIFFREYVLDSGAFTAHSSGEAIDVAAYRDAVMRYCDMGFPPAEVFALDVIGDWRGTLKNTEYLWSQGIRAIPAFHYGEPEDVLLGMAKDYPKIALGGAVGRPALEKKRWVQQCFARVWPVPIHGFGFGLWAVKEFPFHTVDCSDWEGSAARFGRWKKYGQRNLGLNGKALLDHLGVEVLHWLEQEHRARQQWKRTVEAVGWTTDVGRPFLEREVAP